VAAADVVLAAGTEIAEPDLWAERFAPQGQVIRIDIDPDSLARPHPAGLPILADAAQALAGIAAAIEGAVEGAARRERERQVAELRRQLAEEADELRGMLSRVLAVIRRTLPADTIIASDMTQIAYAANEVFPLDRPGQWLHPVGFGTLGYALPAAIGARAGCPDRPVAALMGDYGFQYTSNELGTAAELGGPLAVLLWNNDALGQIRDDMIMKGIQPNAVTLRNPDFGLLARAYGCEAEKPQTLEALEAAIGRALKAARPSLIEMGPSMVR
jgi:thiamine pyrophosphate-dependent acetolactate synthase large subunit-like protein